MTKYLVIPQGGDREFEVEGDFLSTHTEDFVSITRHHREDKDGKVIRANVIVALIYRPMAVLIVDE